MLETNSGVYFWVYFWPTGLIGGIPELRVYSLRSVSIGSTDAAWRAGT
jgi:hypothetical protein